MKPSEQGQNLVVVLQLDSLSSVPNSKPIVENRARPKIKISRGNFFIKACFALLAANIFSVNAQDIIILQNKKEIKAKVIEVTSSQIIYKFEIAPYDHPHYDPIYDSPIIKSVARENVFAINYEDGTQEIINPIKLDKSVINPIIGGCGCNIM